MNSKHTEKDNQVCYVCDTEFNNSEALKHHIESKHGVTSRNNRYESTLLTCNKCGDKSKDKRELQDHTTRYHFEKTLCGNSLCYDKEGIGLGCVCHLCEAVEDDNSSEVSLDEERLIELLRLAGENEEE